ncbi:MAG: hypothetical protein J4N73_00670 [Chloroflexi bacterium]|nr:hypothetical protein [Chloroflexota bacterium]
MSDISITSSDQGRRKLWLRSVGLVALLGFAVSACSELKSSEEPVGKEITVFIDEQGYDPKSFEIAQGDTVIFENVGEEPHWPASNIHPTHRMYPEAGAEYCGTDEQLTSFDACAPLMPGDSYRFKFNHPGTWRFHDHLNPEFGGKVNVLEVEGIADPALQTEPTERPERAYDDDIPEISPEIFQDEGALYSYIRKYGPALTIQYLYELQAEYGDCHSTAHKAGRYAYEIFNAQAFQTCSAECHSGCYHGATESYFRDKGTANLEQDLAIICSSGLNPFFSHQCFHGVGHGLMAFSDYELLDALSNCDLIPDGAESCYSGVFMENVVGGLSPTIGHFTDYLSDDPQFPCDIVPEKYKNACYFYQTSRMVQIFDWDFSKVAEACGEAGERYQQPCFESMGRDVGGLRLDNNIDAIADCGAAPLGNPRIWCLTGAVQNSFWVPDGQDVALDFCSRLDVPGEKQSCYDTIIRRAPLVIEAEADLEAFCLKAEESFQDECLKAVAIAS